MVVFIGHVHVALGITINLAGVMKLRFFQHTVAVTATGVAAREALICAVGPRYIDGSYAVCHRTGIVKERYIQNVRVQRAERQAVAVARSCLINRCNLVGTGINFNNIAVVITGVDATVIGVNHHTVFKSALGNSISCRPDKLALAGTPHFGRVE